MRDFKKITAWQHSHLLTLKVYDVTARLPAAELYGLTSQLRRAAASIPANIAEGAGRDGDAEFARYLSMAMGSANELEYHLILARDLGYLTLETHAELAGSLDEVKRTLSGLLRRVRSDRHHS